MLEEKLERCRVPYSDLDQPRSNRIVRKCQQLDTRGICEGGGGVPRLSRIEAFVVVLIDKCQPNP